MVVEAFITVLSLLAAGSVVRLRPRLAGTTLQTAWLWGVGAVLLVSGSCVWSLGRSAGAVGRADAWWYVTAVVALCPWLAVLGARRPGVRAWTWFVLWPLVAVLGVPVLSVGWSTSAELEVPAPLLLGYGLVLLMGVGNYVGTRYTLPAALAGLGNCLLVAPLSSFAPAWIEDSAWACTAGSAALAAAVLWAEQVSRFAAIVPPGLDRVWYDFRDTFGIVWARRVLDRVNQRAEAEGWQWRLTDGGLVATTPAPASPAEDPRIEHTFRWLLRRFVDPDWIDRRLAERPV